MPPTKTKQVPETIQVTVVYSQSGVKVKEDQELTTLNVRNFQTAPAEVSVSVGGTLNLGNFESARIDVGVKIPCYVEEIDFSYEYAEAWVNKRMEEEVQKVREFIKNKETF